MTRKTQALGLAFFLVGVAIAAWAQIAPPNRVVSERFIVRRPSGIPEPLKISPDSKRLAYIVASRRFFTGNKWLVVVDGKEEKSYDDIVSGQLRGSPIFSPDSRRVAYTARVGDKRFVVVDGKEEKPYDDIGLGTPIFSPDSQRAAYGAKVGNKAVVVVDEKEGKQYDAIVTTVGGRIVFDSPDTLHYLVAKGSEIYLVEERIE